MIYLVRHAKAGRRAEWTGDDRLRPLTPAGERQAAALAERLAPEVDGRIVSSPYLRCVQTVTPLATLLLGEVVLDDRLAEDRSFSGTLDLIDELPDRSVLCSHGDVIPATIEALERRSCRIVGAPDWRKASVWVLERVDGDIRTATAWPPPQV